MTLFSLLLFYSTFHTNICYHNKCWAIHTHLPAGCRFSLWPLPGSHLARQQKCFFTFFSHLPRPALYSSPTSHGRETSLNLYSRLHTGYFYSMKHISYIFICLQVVGKLNKSHCTTNLLCIVCVMSHIQRNCFLSDGINFTGGGGELHFNHGERTGCGL